MTSNRTVLAFALTAGVGLMGLSLGGCNSTAKALGISRRTLQYRIAEYERSGVRVSPPADD